MTKRLLPRKVFTLFKLDTQAKWHRSPAVGLVFQDLDAFEGPATYEPLISDMLKHPLMEEMFGDYCVAAIRRADQATENRCRVVIGQFGSDMPPAWKMSGDVYVKHNDVIVKEDMLDIWGRCMDMRKWIECGNCEHKGDDCIRMHTKMPLNQLHLPLLSKNTQWDDLMSPSFNHVRLNNVMRYDDRDTVDLVNWKTEVAGFTFIPPQYGSIYAGFGGLYKVCELGSTDLQGYVDLFNDASVSATDAAATRKFKKKECAKCVLKGYKGMCSTYVRPARDCKHGAWTENEIIAYSLKGIAKDIDAYKLGSKYESYDWRRFFSGMLEIGGELFKIKNPDTKRNIEWSICGLKYQSAMVGQPRLSIQVHRHALAYKADTNHWSVNADTFFEEAGDRIRTMFERATVVPDKLLAVATHFIAAHTMKPYMAGGGRAFIPAIPTIEYVRSRTYDIEVGYFMKTYKRSRGYSSVEEVFDYFDGDFPFFSHLNPNGDHTRIVYPR